MSVVSVDLNPGSIIDGLGKLVDELFTSDEEREQAKAVLAKLQHAERLGQIQVNTQEAQHRSLWVAGWRPFVGWVCGAALAYNIIVRDLISWAFLNFGDGTLTPPPSIGIEEAVMVLGGMLGFGAYRTFEKVKGKAK